MCVYRLIQQCLFWESVLKDTPPRVYLHKVLPCRVIWFIKYGKQLNCPYPGECLIKVGCIYTAEYQETEKEWGRPEWSNMGKFPRHIVNIQKKYARCLELPGLGHQEGGGSHWAIPDGATVQRRDPDWLLCVLSTASLASPGTHSQPPCRNASMTAVFHWVRSLSRALVPHLSQADARNVTFGAGVWALMLQSVVDVRADAGVIINNYSWVRSPRLSVSVDIKDKYNNVWTLLVPDIASNTQENAKNPPPLLPRQYPLLPRKAWRKLAKVRTQWKLETVQC